MQFQHSSDGVHRFFPPVREPRIVLTWLIRLRWLAIVGQLSATLVAHLLGLNAPLWPVLLVAALTIVTNFALLFWPEKRAIPTSVLLGLFLFDMLLLTILLICTGGPDNPFNSLYLIHVAMAVTTLGGGWTWVVVAAAALLYGTLFVITPVPLTTNGPAPIDIYRIGLWTNLVLIGTLIAYFSARVNRSLRRRELEVGALRERNARNEKLSTVTTLAAGAAHELGTPLATIAVVAKELELAISKLPDSADLVEDAQLIRQECNRCRFILDRMRVEVASDDRPASTPVEELLQLLAMHLTEAERERLKITGPQAGVRVAVPCAAIEQSLTVMIRNGMDADAAGQPVRLDIRVNQSTIFFDVIDLGHGMDEQTIKRAGEPFFTTKAPGRGMGLGLFLVRLVAENFRGRFTLTSTPGAGTTSTLELPLS